MDVDNSSPRIVTAFAEKQITLYFFLRMKLKVLSTKDFKGYVLKRFSRSKIRNFKFIIVKIQNGGSNVVDEKVENRKYSGVFGIILKILKSDLTFVIRVPK